ncbi:UNVERIFIED_CONTAM: hypothetical protein Sradi_2953700 [Sesamum radiatum]|uniref:RRM domain-containing protein n=1 Tax=Sesamum radiatum TaxID=300843 RepID=A0AAW2S0I4_SESRA
MLSLGKFPTQVQYSTLLHNPISQYFQFLSKPNFSVSTRLYCGAVLGKSRNGLRCNATKTKKNGDFSLTEMEGPDEFEDDFDDEFLDVEDDGEFEGDEDDDDDVVVPLQNMKRWLENRPRGFGEGKVYDTSIEDKLMEEIEQSRKAQLANLNKLKNSPVNPSTKKETREQDKVYTPLIFEINLMKLTVLSLLHDSWGDWVVVKALPWTEPLCRRRHPTVSTEIPDGFRVRLLNLPKKKNIHRDLKLAFKEVPGILNIVPVVSGNEKTRDPVCKGLAFIDFKYQDEAQRFVQNFTGKSISFGKVQKQIKCEMMSLKLPNPAYDQSVDDSTGTHEQVILNFDENLNASLEADVSPFDSWEESISGELDTADEGHEEINATSTPLGYNLGEKQGEIQDSAINSSPSKQGRKLRTNAKKGTPKRNKDKILKLNIPGSANRLKIREKEMLTGVFSKYGGNVNSTAKEQSR